MKTFKHPRLAKAAFIITIIAIVLSMAVAVAAIVYFKPFRPTPTVAAVQAPPAPTIYELWTDTNKQRQTAAVSPLALDSRLNASAQAKADEIARTGVFEHVGSGGKRGITYMTDIGMNCIAGGENLAGNITSQKAIDDWMGSPGHKAAMLNSAIDLVGFGISQGPGYYYVVGHYCKLP